MNKKNNPDRRFKDNPQLPIALYEELKLKSPTGLNVQYKLSRLGGGEKLNEAIAGLASLLTPSLSKEESTAKVAPTLEENK